MQKRIAISLVLSWAFSMSACSQDERISPRSMTGGMAGGGIGGAASSTGGRSGGVAGIAGGGHAGRAGAENAGAGQAGAVGGTAGTTGGQAGRAGAGTAGGGQAGAFGGTAGVGQGGGGGMYSTLAITFDSLSLPNQPAVYQRLGLTAAPTVASNQTLTSDFGLFKNSYDPAYSSWSGFAYSRDTDTTTAGYTNQFSAVTGSGAYGSTYYGVAYDFGTGTSVSFLGTTVGYQLTGAFVTNTTYAYLSMRDGDAFAKKFGGPTGTDPDWFRLDITGVRADLTKTAPLACYLADFRSTDSAQDYIVNDWRWVDLSALGKVVGLEFALTSTDSGTPTYFALDSITIVVP
jgi:hypothetical protein